MNLLLAQNLIKSYGPRTLFSVEKLEIQDGDRIGLVGFNGAGKSTLLHILAGTEPCDEGVITRRCPAALIEQDGDSNGTDDGKLLRALSLTGSACKSGGERTRLALASALAQDTPLLFADEPTTNLDLNGIETLQKLFENRKGALVLVSHDRALLDALCTSIWAVQDGSIRVFSGTYSEWVEQRNREREFAQFEYEQFRSEKKRLETEARNIRQEADSMLKAPRRMGNSEARLHKGTTAALQGYVASRSSVMRKRAELLEEKVRPSNLPEVRMALGTTSPVTSKTAARIEGLTVRYGEKTVLKDTTFALTTGKRTVMLGPNGAGKTTLLEHLMRGGDCARFSKGVQAGYFSQNHDVLEPDKTVLENVRAASDLPEHEVRTILANLCITGDDVHKPVSVLSGGERAKTALARLLASSCNLLVLDEPTNHIDLYTAEALETLLQKWRGTLLIVTHDRRLAEHVAERLLFVENGGVRAFEGSWAQWQEEQNRRAAPPSDMSLLIEQMRQACSASAPDRSARPPVAFRDGR